MTRLRLPHAIVVRLHVRKRNVVILTPERAVGFSIQDEAMDIARSAPQGAHYHAVVIYLLLKLGVREGARALWYSELSLLLLGSRPTVFLP